MDLQYFENLTFVILTLSNSSYIIELYNRHI
nr:MAG TPA: hypothetical protein [Caudoviricetes sp.]